MTNSVPGRRFAMFFIIWKLYIALDGSVIALISYKFVVRATIFRKNINNIVNTVHIHMICTRCIVNFVSTKV